MHAIRYLFAALVLAIGIPALPAQNPGCDGFRYKHPLFPTVKKTTVPYATAINYFGQTVTLSMDVYEPQGDTVAMRPVVVLAHGGSFIFGDKSDMSRWAELLAKQGYVAASIQYRLYPVLVLGWPDSTKIMGAAIKAVGDMKAAVRYFREDAATANLFRADPDHISIGGLSAGAVTALHAAYLDDSDVIPPFIQNIINANGGLNGNSGSASNQSYSSAVEAVINMSGGLYRRGWIGADEPPLSSIHGTADATVPFLSGLAANLAYLEGSGLLHEQALAAGTWTYLKKVPGAGHTNLYEQAQYAEQLNNYWMRTTTLLEFLSCYVDTMPVISDLFDRLPTKQQEWSLYPNPVAQGQPFFIELPENLTHAGVILYDISGKAVRQVENVQPGISAVSVAGLAPGVYLVVLSGSRSGQTSSVSRKILIK